MSDYFDRVERQIARRVQDGLPRRARLPVTLGHLAVAAAVVVVVVVAGVFLLARGVTPSSSPAAHPALTVVFTPSRIDSRDIVRSVQILRERLHEAVPAARVSSAGGHITVHVPNGAPGDPGAGCLALQQALALATRLARHAPRRTEYIGALNLHVPTGVVVLQATGAGSPEDQVYLLKDRPVLSGNDIVKPRQGTDPNTSVPNVTFGFTPRGARIFKALTATLAHRGAQVSGLGRTLNQHFAVALDNKLIDVPFVGFKQYPEGITITDVVQLSGEFTPQSARNLAILLRFGPLPVNVTAAG